MHKRGNRVAARRDAKQAHDGDFGQRGGLHARVGRGGVVVDLDLLKD